MLPRTDRVLHTVAEHEAPARIFNAAGRAELWAAGNGESHGNGHGNGNGSRGSNGKNGSPASSVPESRSSIREVPYVSTSEPVLVFNEHPRRDQSSTTIEDLGSAFSRSGLVRE